MPLPAISLPRIQVLRVLLDHAQHVPAIVTAVQAVGSAVGAAAKLEAVQFLIGLLIPLAEDIEPLLSNGGGFAAAADPVAEEGELAGAYGAAPVGAISWAAIMAALPVVIELLERLLPLVLAGDAKLGSDSQ